MISDESSTYFFINGMNHFMRVISPSSAYQHLFTAVQKCYDLRIVVSKTCFQRGAP